MRTLLGAIALSVLGLGIASPASAGDRVWSVPGVINDGLSTVFMCTNGGSAPATVSVTVLRKDGTPDYTPYTATAAPGATATFVTKVVVSLLPGGFDVNMASGFIPGGSARITAPSGVYCVAYVVDS